MKQDEELWIKKIKEKLEDYSESPPTDGWTRLEKELTPARRIYPLKWWTAAAVVLLALSAISLLFLRSPIAHEVRHTSVEEHTSVPDVMPERPLPETLKTAAVRIPASAPKKRTAEPSASIDKVKPEAEAEVTNESVEEPEATEAKIEKKEEPTAHKPSGKDKLHLPSDEMKGQTAKTTRKGWSVGMAVNPGVIALSSENQLYDYSGGPRPYDLVAADGLIYTPDNGTTVFEGDIPYFIKTDEVLEAKHHQPISFGLTVRKALTGRLSLETGLMYTLLSSDIKLSSNPSVFVDQKLHYIGIPVKANWSFVDSRLFTLYASAGGAVEKCVYGKLNGKKNTVGPLQVSLLGGIGAQYNITRKFGLYVEPGVSYFFDDGSDTETIRKDKPFNFNIQAGVRFSY